MNRVIVFSTLLEIAYLSLSFLLSKIFGQWSWIGEVLRTDLRIVSIMVFGFIYQKYFYNEDQKFQSKEVLSPHFVAAIILLILFAVVFTNGKNEPLIWQIVFLISGITAGLREELFYRGIIQNTLQTRYGFKTALVAANIPFVLSHAPYLYHGQFKALMLIALAGLIFGGIFIHTGSVVITSIIHSLYDAVLAVNVVSFSLNYSAQIPILLMIMSLFFLIISKKLFVTKPSENSGNSDQDKFSLP